MQQVVDQRSTLLLFVLFVSCFIGGECYPVSADVRNADEVLKAIEKGIEKFGRLDILVNGAAGNFLCLAENLSFNAFKVTTT